MSTKSKVMYAAMSLAFAGSLVAGSAFAAAGTSNPVTVASINSMSGSISDLGVPAYDAEQLAINQIDAKGGLLGRKIQLVKFDDAA